jgi:hypothetical protein
MKPPLRLSPLSEEQLDELKELYRTTKQRVEKHWLCV